MPDKIYCGSGKRIDTKYGEIYSITVDLEALYLASKQGHSSEYNGKKYIKLDLAERREPSGSGKTHYLVVNTYKPERRESYQGANDRWPDDKSDPASPQFEDDIPF